MAVPIGLAIDKNQPEYLAWLKALNDGMKAKLDADEVRIINAM
jgi:polar amino acid transport system substrate-binding protein